MAVNPEPGSPIMRTVLTTTVAVAAFCAFVGTAMFSVASPPGLTHPPEVHSASPVITFLSIGVSVIIIWFLISLAHKIKTK